MISFNDTPIERQSIKDMTESQMNALIEQMQERRMRSHTLYMEAMRLKEEKQHEKDAERLEKLCSMMEKVFKSVDAGLEKLRKYSTEIRVIKLALE